MPEQCVAFLLTVDKQSSINNYDVESSCSQRSGKTKGKLLWLHWRKLEQN